MPTERAKGINFQLRPPNNGSSLKKRQSANGLVKKFIREPDEPDRSKSGIE